ncbi:MAG: hypothetical protein V1661_02125 [bacterium]
MKKNIYPVGFSTGCLYQSGWNLNKQVEFYCSLGVSAIELGFAHPAHLLNFNLSPLSMEQMRKLDWISIHAPWKEIRYNECWALPAMLIKKLESLCNQLPIRGIVAHPDVIDDFGYLQRTGLPFLIENQDKRRGNDYSQPEHFQKLANKYRFGFCLDLQHCYEHDSSMILAEEFIKMLGDRIKELHVSGQSPSEIHYPVVAADNKNAIARILRLKPDFPLILEGTIIGSTKTIQTMAGEELKFVTGLTENDNA